MIYEKILFFLLFSQIQKRSQEPDTNMCSQQMPHAEM